MFTECGLVSSLNPHFIPRALLTGISPKGPDPDIGGFSIEFSVVGPYPPLKEGDKAPVSNTASAEVGSKVKWTRVNFDELSLRELNKILPNRYPARS